MSCQGVRVLFPIRGEGMQKTIITFGNDMIRGTFSNVPLVS